MKVILAIILGTAITLPDPLEAAGRTPDCATIAARVERQAKIPEGLLVAIARVESGRRWTDGGVRGWPWTINHAGRGQYFGTEAEALAEVEALVAEGEWSIDIGCMQVNLRWHGERFASLAEMIDPEVNVAYAAHFLTRLRRQHGSWEAAVRHYHSATEELGEAYLSRVLASWKGVPEAGSERLAKAELVSQQGPQPREAPKPGWRTSLGLWASSAPVPPIDAGTLDNAPLLQAVAAATDSDWLEAYLADFDTVGPGAVPDMARVAAANVSAPRPLGPGQDRITRFRDKFAGGQQR